MSKPIILSDNLFENVALHPTFVLSTTGTEVSGAELFHIADNLRDMTRFTVSETNTIIRVVVDCGVAQDATALILERGHNLSAMLVALSGADDAGFTVNVVTPISNETVPSTPSGLPGSVNGCLTPDGVWWRTWGTLGAKRYWRFTIAAMGVGLSPILRGLYLGASYRFPEYLNAPAAYDYGTNVKYMRNEISRGGVRSKSRPINMDKLDLDLELESTDYAPFDVELRRLLRYGQPWWFCLDDSDATGAGLMRFFQTSQDTDYEPQVDPVHRQIRLALEEVIPTLYV